MLLQVMLPLTTTIFYRHFDLFQGASQSNAFPSVVFYFMSGNDQHIQIAIFCDFASRVRTEQNDLFWVSHLDKTAYHGMHFLRCH